MRYSIYILNGMKLCILWNTLPVSCHAGFQCYAGFAIQRNPTCGIVGR